MSSGQTRQGVKVQRRKIQTHKNADTFRHARISEMRKRKRDLLTRINYPTVISSVVLPFLAILHLFHSKKSLIPSNTATLWFSVFYYNFTILAFTAGYHKCYAHSLFRPKFSFLQLYFCIFGASLGVGPIRWWAALHRAHHQYTDDAEKDPSSMKRGFLWAHWGWLLKRSKSDAFFRELVEEEFSSSPGKNELQSFEERKKVFYDNVTREFILWQESKYWLLFVITSLVIPAIVTVLYCQDSWINGLVYPGLLRMFACQQLVLSAESLGHAKKLQITFPSQPFNDKNSLVNCSNPIVALLTYGQNLQNYHHEFLHDYRDTSYLWAFDPTKWFISVLSSFGLVDNVCITPTNLVVQLQIQQQQEVLNRMRSQLNWGTPISKLPVISTKNFRKTCESADNKHRIYIVVQNIIHDITPFMDQHPGGIALLKASHGKDATKAFFGGVYGHLTAAVNLLATMRVGVLDLGNDEDVWRRVVREEGEVNLSSTRERQTGLHLTAEAA